MKKFEYKKVPTEIDFDYLNELGKEGWEVVTSSDGSYLLKREIQKPKPDEKQLLNESYALRG